MQRQVTLSFAWLQGGCYGLDKFIDMHPLSHVENLQVSMAASVLVLKLQFVWQSHTCRQCHSIPE